MLPPCDRKKERAVPHIQTSRADSPDIERPSCDACGSQMWLREVARAGHGTEARIFECPVCEVAACNPQAQSRGDASESRLTTADRAPL